MTESLDVFAEFVEARLRSQDQRLVSLVSTVQRGEESINELKDQLKETVERQLDGTMQEVRDCVCQTSM